MTSSRPSLSRFLRRLKSDSSGSSANWVAMVEQHHRMVRAMVLASPVHPPLLETEPERDARTP